MSVFMYHRHTENCPALMFVLAPLNSFLHDFTTEVTTIGTGGGRGDPFRRQLIYGQSRGSTCDPADLQSLYRPSIQVSVTAEQSVYDINSQW